MHILVVDDSQDNHLVLKHFLHSAGYTEVEGVRSATEAFRRLGMETSDVEGKGVDLILMDIVMPDINGIEACRRIKAVERLRDIPIIMITAKTETEDLEAGFAAGAIDYMAKPVNRVELLARVRSALALKRESDDRRLREQELAKKNEELEQALKEVKVLRGFIPICAACKKVRDDQGYWQEVEAYISERSDTQFSHGICADCAKKLYPDLFQG
jgi:CheY-like chemotaxis protein